MSIKITPFTWDQTKMTLNLNFLTHWTRNLLNVTSNQVLSSMSYCVPTCTIQTMGSFFSVTLNNLALQATQLQFYIYNIISPATLETADSVSVSIIETTYNSNVQAGALSVASKYPNNLQILTASTTNKVGEQVSLDLTLTTQDLFSASDTITITLSTTLSMASQINITNPLVTTFTSQVQQNYKITLSGFTLVTSIPSQFSGIIGIHNISSQLSVKPVTGNVISFFRNGALYDQSTFSFQVVPATMSNITLALASQNANAATNLTVTI